MLITKQYQPEGHWESPNRVESLSSGEWVLIVEVVVSRNITFAGNKNSFHKRLFSQACTLTKQK